MAAKNYSTWVRFGDKWTRYSFIRSGGGDDKPANTILIIPGNPGNDLFYADLAAYFVEFWKKDCQIYTLAHLNHVPLPPGLAKIDPTQLSERFNLKEQVSHAGEFVRQIVAPTMPNKTIWLIGHSIGTYIGAALVSINVGNNELMFIGSKAGWNVMDSL
jgi:pimeloyl-ACP methyl ester carboxylesterase